MTIFKTLTTAAATVLIAFTGEACGPNPIERTPAQWKVYYHDHHAEAVDFQMDCVKRGLGLPASAFSKAEIARCSVADWEYNFGIPSKPPIPSWGNHGGLL